MKTQREQSGIIKPAIIDDSQLDVQFKDGRLIHMSVMTNNGEMQLQAPGMSLIDEPTITNENIYFRNGELHLTAENLSLIDEIKILIRKLWN